MKEAKELRKLESEFNGDKRKENSQFGRIVAKIEEIWKKIFSKTKIVEDSNGLELFNNERKSLKKKNRLLEQLLDTEKLLLNMNRKLKRVNPVLISNKKILLENKRRKELKQKQRKEEIRQEKENLQRLLRREAQRKIILGRKSLFRSPPLINPKTPKISKLKTKIQKDLRFFFD